MSVADRVQSIRELLPQGRKRLILAINSGKLPIQYAGGRPGGYIKTSTDRFFIILSEKEIDRGLYGDEVFDQLIGHTRYSGDEVDPYLFGDMIGGDREYHEPTLSEADQISHKVDHHGDHHFTIHAHSGKRHVGFIEVSGCRDSKDGKDYRVEGSFVAKEHRGKGIGHGLYNAAIEESKKRGAHRLHSTVSVTNDAGKIYHRLKVHGHDVEIRNNGKHPNHDREGYYSHWKDGPDTQSSGYIVHLHHRHLKLAEGPGDDKGIANESSYATKLALWPEYKDLHKNLAPRSKDSENSTYWSKHNGKEYFVKKPETFGQYDGHKEIAFAEMAHALGHSDIVPPVQHHIDDKKVSMERIWGKTLAELQKKDPHFLDKVDHDSKLKAALLDYVAGNLDRHQGNILFDNFQGDPKMKLIDHGMAFHPEFNQDMDPFHLTESLDTENHPNWEENPNRHISIKEEHVKPYIDKRNQIESILNKHGLSKHERSGVQERIDLLGKFMDDGGGTFGHLNDEHNKMAMVKRHPGIAKAMNKIPGKKPFGSDVDD